MNLTIVSFLSQVFSPAFKVGPLSPVDAILTLFQQLSKTQIFLCL